jgi:hypothetical protein
MAKSASKVPFVYTSGHTLILCDLGQELGVKVEQVDPRDPRHGDEPPAIILPPDITEALAHYLAHSLSQKKRSALPVVRREKNPVSCNSFEGMQEALTGLYDDNEGTDGEADR